MQSQVVEYSIVGFHRKAGHLQVVFFNRGETVGIPFSIELERDGDGAYPSGMTLDEQIRRHIPYDLLDRGSEGLPSGAMQSILPCRLFEDGVSFITEEQLGLFAKRPLVRNNGLPLPVDVF